MSLLLCPRRGPSRQAAVARPPDRRRPRDGGLDSQSPARGADERSPRRSPGSGACSRNTCAATHGDPDRSCTIDELRPRPRAAPGWASENSPISPSGRATPATAAPPACGGPSWGRTGTSSSGPTAAAAHPGAGIRGGGGGGDRPPRLDDRAQRPHRPIGPPRRRTSPLREIKTVTAGAAGGSGRPARRLSGLLRPARRLRGAVRPARGSRLGPRPSSLSRSTAGWPRPWRWRPPTRPSSAASSGS